MATVNKSWTFTSSAEGLTDVGDSAILFEKDPGDPSVHFFGAASGIQERGRGPTGETWETWGVPAGATVTNVQITAWSTRRWANARTGTISLRVVDSGGATVTSAGDLATYNFVSGTDGSWQSRGAGTIRDVDSGKQASNTNIRLEIELDISSAQSGLDIGVDTITVQMTYSTGATVSDTRDFRIIGSLVSEISRDLRITGQSSDNASRDIRVKGQAVSSDSRDVRITGQITDSISNNFRVTGQNSSNINRDFRIVGQAGSNLAIDVRVVGQLMSNDLRDFRTTGQGGTNDVRDFRIIGQSSSADTRESRITGAIISNVARDFRITGQVLSNQSIDFKTVGQSSSSIAIGIRVSGFEPQILRPIADNSTGVWGLTPLYEKIDEIIADDGDYVFTPSSSTFEVQFEAGIIPITGEGFVRYRLGKDIASGTVDQIVSLYSGGTLIKSWTHNDVSVGFTGYEQTLTTGEVAGIPDFTDLRLRVQAVIT